MHRIRVYERGRGFRDEKDLERIPALAAPPSAVVWAILSEPSEAELAQVQQALRLHPLTMEDLTQYEDRPRIRFYGAGVSVVFFAGRTTETSNEPLTFIPFHLFLGRDVLVTVHREGLQEIDSALRRWEESADNLPLSAEAPLYILLDTVVDGYMPLLERVAEQVDRVEDQVIEGTSEDDRRTVFVLKRDLLRLRRITGSGRDVLNGLIRYDETTPESDAIYLRDVYDNLARLADQVDTYRDLLGNVVDASLAVTSNRLAESSNALNLTMKTLTAWSIILGSGTFIAGLYGMNVQGLPMAGHPQAFSLVGGITLLVGTALLLLFRRLRWM
jgi:magnesium transporter